MTFIGKLSKSSLTSISQARDDVQRIIQQLDNFMRYLYNADLVSEVVMYKDFYSEMENALKLTIDCNENAEDSVLDLEDKLTEMIAYAACKLSENDGSSLHRLHDEFLAQKDDLKLLIDLTLSKLIHSLASSVTSSLSEVMDCFGQGLQEVSDDGYGGPAFTRVGSSEIEGSDVEDNKILRESPQNNFGIGEGDKDSCFRFHEGIATHRMEREGVKEDYNTVAEHYDSAEKFYNRAEDNYTSARKYYRNARTYYSLAEQHRRIAEGHRDLAEGHRRIAEKHRSIAEGIASELHLRGTVEMKEEVTDRDKEPFLGVFGGTVIRSASAAYAASDDDDDIMMGEPQLKSKKFTSDKVQNNQGITLPGKEGTETEFNTTTKTEKDQILQKLRTTGNSHCEQVSLGDVENTTAKEALDDYPSVEFAKPGAKQVGESLDSHSISTIEPTSTKVLDLRTLEDSLKFFGLHTSLQQLEESLENVRRQEKTPEQHEAEFKRFDQEIQQLFLKHHPDEMKNMESSDVDVPRSKMLQNALHATRRVLNILNKRFLEDIDTDHKYESFFKLDIRLLGKDDGKIVNRVYGILFKVCLVSKIKQEGIVAEVGKFLSAAQSCVESYIEHDRENFEKHSSSAFRHLKRSIEGYSKLLQEYETVGEECKSDKLLNIFPLISKMRSECSKQLSHLEALIKLAEQPLGEQFRRIYVGCHGVDDYFVLPFVCYTNVILMCSVMFNSDATKRRWSNWFGKSSTSGAQEDIDGDDEVSILYYLATSYKGNAQYKRKLLKLLKLKHLSKKVVEEKFLEKLITLKEDLELKFKIEDYVEGSTKEFITEQLGLCKEMKEEFEEYWKEIVEELDEVVGKNLKQIVREYEEFNKKLMERLAEGKKIMASNNLPLSDECSGSRDPSVLKEPPVA